MIHFQELNPPPIFPDPLIEVDRTHATALDDCLLDLRGRKVPITLLERLENELLELPPVQWMGNGPVNGAGKGLELLMCSRVHEIRIYTFSSPYQEKILRPFQHCRGGMQFTRLAARNQCLKRA